MLSSVNAFGGLSSAELLVLFGANSTSSSSDSKATNAAQSASPGVSGPSTNDPANAIKAILAQAQMETSAGGSASILTVAAAYAAQTGDSSSVLSASVTVSSPDAVQQIDDAVSEINSLQVISTQTYLDGVGSITSPVTVTAADAVNMTIGNDGVSVTAALGATLPSELPSLASIQQAISTLSGEPSSSPKLNSPYEGSLTLVKLPQNAAGGIGGNLITFSAAGNQWALVLPQNTVSVTMSDAQTQG